MQKESLKLIYISLNESYLIFLSYPNRYSSFQTILQKLLGTKFRQYFRQFWKKIAWYWIWSIYLLNLFVLNFLFVLILSHCIPTLFWIWHLKNRYKNLWKPCRGNKPLKLWHIQSLVKLCDISNSSQNKKVHFKGNLLSHHVCYNLNTKSYWRWV